MCIFSVFYNLTLVITTNADNECSYHVHIHAHAHVHTQARVVFKLLLMLFLIPLPMPTLSINTPSMTSLVSLLFKDMLHLQLLLSLRTHF